MQTEGASRESSRPLQEGNEASVVTIQSVSDVEVPFSLALTAGSNLGAQFSEHSITGNGPGCSSQSTCRGQPDVFPGDQRLRPQSPLRRKAVRHDDRVHGSRSRSRRPDRSLSRSTSRLPRAYCSRSRGKSRSAVRSRSRGRYRSVSTTKSRCSRSNSRSLCRSSSGSLHSHGSRSRRSNSHRSRRDSGRRSRRSHRSHRGHRSRSKTVNRRPQGRSRRSRSHGRRHKSRSLSVPSGRSYVSLEPAVRLGFQKENDPSSFGSSNTTSSFSGFSTVPVTVSQKCTRGGVFDHGVQPDMCSLIRQILSEELRSISSNKKRSRSRSS